MNENRYVLAAFERRDGADKAVVDLIDGEFDIDDISVVAKYMDKKFSDELPGKNKEVAEDVSAGMIGGALAGGISGLLASVGVLPGMSGVLIGGQMAGMLGLTGSAAIGASGAVTGGAAGSLIGVLVGLGISRSDAEYYNDVIADDGVILAVAVEGDSRESRATDTLSKYMGKRINVAPEKTLP